jgi:hypothetical protein
MRHTDLHSGIVGGSCLPCCADFLHASCALDGHVTQDIYGRRWSLTVNCDIAKPHSITRVLAKSLRTQSGIGTVSPP